MSSTLVRIKPTPLDLPSESIFIWEQEGVPQTDYAGFSFSGKCDPAALNQAFLQAQAGRPNFHANLILTRMGLFRVLAWHLREEPNELQVRDFSSMDRAPDDLEAWLHRQMAGEVDHCQDLSSEYPVKLILFLLPSDLCCIVILFHHVVTDGGGVYDFMRDLFRHYHRETTGAEPAWADAAGLHAQAGDAKPVVPVSTWQFLKYSLGQLWKYPPTRLAQIKSDPAGGAGRNMIRHIFDDRDLQKALRDRARRDNGTLSDLVMAASKLAVDEFNSSKGEPPDILYHGLAVNQRLRRPPSETEGQGNPMSMLNILSNREDRKDPRSLLRYVIDRRKYMIEQGHDIVLTRISRKILLASRLLPIGLRTAFLRLIVEMRISFFLTNLGVVWPRMENGRPTGETAIRQVGGMDLLDIHASVGTTKRNPIALILRTFLGRFYMVFTVGRHGISDADADQFSRLLVKKLLDYL